jgi:hypothetical protein
MSSKDKEREMTDLEGSVMKITPAMAKGWVEKHNHPDNRSVGWSAVEAFANDMRNGNWKLTHQGICFDAEGRLIDGQHRLHAIVAAGVAVNMMVLTNKHAQFSDPLDRGRQRSVATVTNLHSRVVSACAMLHRMEIGIPASTQPVTVAETLEVHDKHKAQFDQLDNDSRVLKTGLYAGLYAAVIWTLPIDADRSIDFLSKVQRGEMISRGHPAYSFRTWHERTLRAPPAMMMYAALNCLRHHIQGAKIGNVYVTESGYRASCGKRRAMRVPNTPPVSLVESLSWNALKEKKSPEDAG